MCMRIRAAAPGVAGAVVALLTSAASAAALNDGLYFLSNHPDAAQAPPGYGLRLDDLIDVTPGKDVVTFDFNDSRSDMLMEISGSRIRIFGTAFGGLDTGGEYDEDLSGLWEIDFTFNSVEKMPNDNDFWVPAGSPTNTGTIAAQFGAFGEIPLFDFAGGHPFTFRLGDENSDDGHRGFDGISGWGWMSYGDGEHVKSSDWLFTAVPVPVPPAVLLGAAGLAGMIGVHVGKRRKQARA